MAATNKSLAQINKTQDVGKSDQKVFGSTRCKAGEGRTDHSLLCQLGPAPRSVVRSNMMTHGLSSNQTRALLMRGVKRGRVRQTGRGLYRLARRP
jgi:hypothetical protein